ncbi:MAG: Lrp/AsnC family transcriptional regulator [Clostridia bacterium]|nr:Lrp/AsnC family transcriptional regulator [Clostridia bacterium]
MKELNKKVLSLLEENARYTNKQIADMLGVEEKEVVRVVKELEEDRVIVKYSALVDAEALEERAVQALIEVKVSPQKLKGFDSCAEEISTFPEVTSLYLMSGGFDLAVFVTGKDITSVAKFVSEKLSTIDGIIGVQTHFILKKYKIEGTSVCHTDNDRQIIQA